MRISSSYAYPQVGKFLNQCTRFYNFQDEQQKRSNVEGELDAGQQVADPDDTVELSVAQKIGDSNVNEVELPSKKM